MREGKRPSRGSCRPRARSPSTRPPAALREAGPAARPARPERQATARRRGRRPPRPRLPRPSPPCPPSGQGPCASPGSPSRGSARVRGVCGSSGISARSWSNRWSRGGRVRPGMRQRRLFDAQEGTQVGAGLFGDSLEASGSGAAQEPHEDGFELVVHGMGEEDRARARPLHRRAEDGVAEAPRRRFDAFAFGFDPSSTAPGRTWATKSRAPRAEQVALTRASSVSRSSACPVCRGRHRRLWADRERESKPPPAKRRSRSRRIATATREAWSFRSVRNSRRTASRTHRARAMARKKRALQPSFATHSLLALHRAFGVQPWAVVRSARKFIVGGPHTPVP